MPHVRMYQMSSAHYSSVFLARCDNQVLNKTVDISTRTLSYFDNPEDDVSSDSKKKEGIFWPKALHCSSSSSWFCPGDDVERACVAKGKERCVCFSDAGKTRVRF